MQRRFNKNKMRCGRLLVSMVMIVLTCIYSARAQTSQQQYVAYLNVVRPVMDHPTLSYSYSLSLNETLSGKEEERLTGIFLKNGTHFLDSNSRTLTLSNEGYLFKAQNDDRRAIIYSLKAIQKHFEDKDITGANQILSIPDSLLLKKGKFESLPTAEDKIHFRYVLNNKSGGLQEIQFKITKEKMVLEEVVLIIHDDNKHNRVFTLYDFNNEFDVRRMAISNYFNIAGTKVTLLNRYHSYKVNTLL